MLILLKLEHALVTADLLNQNPTKAAIRPCDLSPRFFCIDATLLCEFESDNIWIYEFEYNRSEKSHRVRAGLYDQRFH